MVDINPSFQQIASPELPDIFESLSREIKKDINCVKIGTIQKYDATLQEVQVQIAFTQVVSVDADGVQTLKQYPVLYNVPIYYPSGGGFTLTFPIAPGDECIILCNDRQLDNWLRAGAGLPPSVGRVHDLSDGIALVGIRNNTRALKGVSTTTTQLRSDDGGTYVEVAGGGIVNVIAPTSFNVTSPIVNINASTSVNLNTPQEVITGILNVQNTNGSSTPCVINGNITTNGDVIAQTISLVNHVHTGVTTGSGNTGAATG